MAHGRSGTYSGSGKSLHSEVRTSLAKVQVFTRFLGYAPEKLKYPIDRYVNETHRLYRTLDSRLAKNGTGYIVSDRVTVADTTIWPWVSAHSKPIDTESRVNTDMDLKVSRDFPRLLYILVS